MVHIINNNRKGGKLYHYAHFICDCLYLEVIYEIYKYNLIYRNNTKRETIGNFKNIYKDVMQCKYFEKGGLNKRTKDTIIIKKRKNNFKNKKYIYKFRKYIFNRYKIDPNIYRDKYPKVLLIKRGVSNLLSNNKNIKNYTHTQKNGKERRSINNVDKVEKYLQNKYKNFKSIYLENISFEEQIKYFNNAKLIICAHGAGMSNMFFCKENKTKLIEITCGKRWEFFNVLSRELNIKHLKCHNNILGDIINFIDKYGIIKDNYIKNRHTYSIINNKINRTRTRTRPRTRLINNIRNKPTYSIINNKINNKITRTRNRNRTRNRTRTRPKTRPINNIRNKY